MIKTNRKKIIFPAFIHDCSCLCIQAGYEPPSNKNSLRMYFKENQNGLKNVVEI